MNAGFIKLRRASETLELLNDLCAFALLTVIALRARRSDEFNIHNLRSGEALIGDYKRYGLTHRQYRSAMKRLSQWGFAVFKPTTRGTVATLCDNRIYDINGTGGDKQETNTRQTNDQRATTNKKEKKYSPHSDEWKLSALLLEGILERKPDFHRPALQRWTGEIDRMIRIDGRTPERIAAVIRWCVKDPFWSNNILSVAKLRKHFDRLELEMDRPAPGASKESTREMVERMEREGTL